MTTVISSLPKSGSAWLWQSSDTTEATMKREPADLIERSLYRRAVEAVICGMPAVNTDLMYQAETGGLRRRNSGRPRRLIC